VTPNHDNFPAFVGLGYALPASLVLWGLILWAVL
jgi:hypothetical protein